jgi:hypothetical protein
MSTILREKCEASVLTNEAIEVHLSYLRPSVEDVQAKLLVLQEKIDKLADRVMKIQASQDGLKWFISSLALLASGISIARSLGWI